MMELEIQRTPLDICLDQLRQTSGPPANPDTASTLAAKLLGGAASLQACSRIILSDLALTLRLLRVGNSAMFNHAGQTTASVNHAAALLGTDVLAQILDSVPRAPLRHPVRELVALSHITAFLSRSLMQRIEPRYAEEAFISGLFRLIGEVCYAHELPDDYRRILQRSEGHIPGFRAACRNHAKFDFDELTVGLLNYWGFHGAPSLAAQSTPEALLAQQGSPETEIALAASVAYYIVAACLRSETVDRERVLRPSLVPLAKLFRIREPQVNEVCESALAEAENLLAHLHVRRENLRFRGWAPPRTAVLPEIRPAANLDKASPVDSVLREALSKGVDRAALLRFDDRALTLAAAAGAGWPGGGPAELPKLVQPQKPPFLFAFGQRQDVWIDLGKDDRFRDTPLTVSLQPVAFFLFPVQRDNQVRGCLYFDWVRRHNTAPEHLLGPLAALRDFLATNMSAA